MLEGLKRVVIGFIILAITAFAFLTGVSAAAIDASALSPASLITPYAGMWQAQISGGNRGSCTIHIHKSGELSGVCRTRIVGYQPVQVFGSVVHSSVHFSFGIFGGGVLFVAHLQGNNGKGTWRDQDPGDSGAWSIQKVE